MTNEDERAPRHPIRVVAHRTGLTPATIRAWERRYQAVDPARSDGGQRLYSDADVEHLDTLRSLTELGRSISSVAPLSRADAAALLTEDRRARPRSVAPPADDAIEALLGDALECVERFDEAGLEQLLMRAAVLLGARPFLEKVVVPLLQRVGAAWAEGVLSPAQEHLGSGVVERVVIWLSDPSIADQDGPSIVIATLPGERHALGARLAAAAASLEGWRTTYLGADLPESEIASAVKRVGASVVAISAVRTDDMDETLESLVKLRELLDPPVSILVGGSAAQLLDRSRLPSGVRLLDNLGAFRELRQNGGRL